MPSQLCLFIIYECHESIEEVKCYSIEAIIIDECHHVFNIVLFNKAPISFTYSGRYTHVLCIIRKSSDSNTFTCIVKQTITQYYIRIHLCAVV